MSEKQIDLLLKGGHVIDPANGIDEKKDIAVRGGEICAVADEIGQETAKKTLDVSGLFVVPGLIDMHCHCYPVFPRHADTLPTIDPDGHMLQSGVTTAVDAGTCGWRDFPKFKEEVIDRSKIRLLAFLNIASGGMVHMDTEEEPAKFHPQITAAAAKEYADAVVGIKSAHYRVGIPFDAAHTPWASVDAAVEAAAQSGTPCMVDMQPNLPERTYPELILTHLRPGDIHTHVYAQQFSLFDGEGKVASYMWEARERGVCFDLGHGAGSFWFRNAVPALRQGFYPDTISTDLYTDNVGGPVISLTHVMSKYLCMGMPLAGVIYRTTVRPAEVIRRPKLGTLSVGACADIALLRLWEEPVAYADSGRARLRGNLRIECAGTIRAGELVYNPYALGMPDWEDAPEAYWRAPGVLTD